MTPAAYQALRDRATGLSAPIYWDNDNETPADPATEPLWVKAENHGIAATVRGIGTAGAHQIRDDGFVRFHLFAARGTQTSAMMDLYAELAALYRVVNFSGIQTYAPTPPGPSGPTDDGNWFVQSFSVPYTFDYQG